MFIVQNLPTLFHFYSLAFRKREGQNRSVLKSSNMDYSYISFQPHEKLVNKEISGRLA